jgi:hypothetical protein
MSFLLPGNKRQLRFSDAEAALGKPRDRKMTGPSRSLGVPGAPTPAPLARGRGFDESNVATAAYVRGDVYEDEHPTMALDNDAREVLPGGSRKPALERPRKLIPQFRPWSSGDAETVVAGLSRPRPFEPREIRTHVSTLTYALWVLAGLLTGVITYHVAPQMLARIESPPAATPQR